MVWIDIIFKKTVAKLFGKYKTAFSKWKRNARFIKQEENARKIQAFLRDRLYNPSDKRKRIVRGAEFLDKYLKRIVFDRIQEYGNNRYIQNVLRKRIEAKDAANKKMLGNAFNRWRNIIPLLRENEAATKIENNYRNLRARRKLDGLRRREEIL